MSIYEEYLPIIGLEIHAELKTKSKMFCSCVNDPDERKPNINICPICMAHPGTLPVLNKEAIQHVLKVGLAIDAKIASFTEWDRKNYFYPDIPKGYQISQYAYPLITEGKVFVNNQDIFITRIHLEEDTARSTHDKGDYSLVDYNRAGLPLMELVTEPVIHDSKTAAMFGRELQLLLRTLDVSDANMELGQMRVEVNISVSKKGQPFGTKVEIKNLNSFKVVEKSIEYEIKRQIDILESGEKVIQETRGYDDMTGKTFSQRAKESAKDYRYFPEPDLPKMYIEKEFDLETLRKNLPELPNQKRLRYESFGIKKEDANMYVIDVFYGEFFDKVLNQIDIKDQDKILLISNYITSDIAGICKKIDINNKQLQEFIKVEHIIDIINLFKKGELSSRGAKDIIALLFENKDYFDKTTLEIANLNGFIIENDPEAINKIIETVINNSQKQVEEYKAGKENLLMYLVGQVMKEAKTQGMAVDPGMLQSLIKNKLN